MRPTVPALDETAVFLDFDGTLVDFAATPEAVVVSPELKALLQALNDRLNGALAMVTGRSLESLDGLLELDPLCAAGCHGAEWRRQAVVETVSDDGEALTRARTSLEQFADRHNLLVEDKPYSLALHFRGRVELQQTIDDWLDEHLRPVENLRVLGGKNVREIQLRGVDKGVAVERFMAHPPFAGRVPVYIGDDVTDEDAFAYVNRVGGLAIKVGEGESLAKYRLADFREVYQWLDELSSQQV